MELNNFPLVSIIIPIYNAEPFLQDTLECAINQVYKKIELILIDDHSTDKSWSIAYKYQSLHSNIILKRNKGKGAAAARNYGFQLSKGEFIQYLDADDVISPEKIASQIDFIKQNEITSRALIGCYWQRFSNSIDYKIGPINPCLNKLSYSEEEWLLSRTEMPPITWLVHRTLISETSGWNESLTRNDDGDFFYRIISKTDQVVIIPKVLSFYRNHNLPSLSKSGNQAHLYSWYISALTYKNIVTEKYGIKGREASDKFFYYLYFKMLLRDENIAQLCKKELYNKKANHEIGDRFVQKLSYYISLKNAKRIRFMINRLRGLPPF
ncbi:glycosyltransferase family 2 protein [Pedobacter glucosidilyticus]|uniref:glycosyltransferase family 2 protein n=1 Tax=Pedobacter glucosidilyticus TaxID=1122941 RepID=UPI00040B56FF|nr:glycosyltransferase family 2 protein [Pedobacter glucosidilyticus]